jgi:post-segregation antitoxin (ccd killing protein)
MRKASYDRNAGKQTVSLTLNADLYVEAKRLGINASQIAEQALAQEVARLQTELLKVEIREDLEALDAYETRYGSFAEMAREHYQVHDDDQTKR